MTALAGKLTSTENGKDPNDEDNTNNDDDGTVMMDWGLRRKYLNRNTVFAVVRVLYLYLEWKELVLHEVVLSRRFLCFFDCCFFFYKWLYVRLNGGR